MTVLAEARQLAHSGDLIFPGPTGRALSSEALSKLFRELAISGISHGLRSSFRSWAAETGVVRELPEAALGHTVRGVEGANHCTTTEHTN